MAVAVHPPRSLNRRVLVVDDDSAGLRAVSVQLEELGYLADATSDPGKAIALASACDYDVVLADLFMPEIDGVDLMMTLARSSPVTSFVLMTGASEFELRDSGILDGRLTTVLAKPLGSAALETALKLAFDVAWERRSQLSAPEAAIRVLLVEDSASDALLLTDALGSLGGYEATHAVRLADAVRLLHEAPFDTVITDLTLPDARGLTSVLRLRECAPDSTLLVCSSAADEIMALRVIELGAQDFIVKGAFEVEQLGRAIRFARVRRQAERRLALLAHSDPLTGLLNRRHFGERLDHALAQAKRLGSRLAVLYIDLDGFKAVNDAYGHDAGDELLQRIAGRLRRCVREFDVVARLGGDEFAVLFTSLEGSLEATTARIAFAVGVPVNLAHGTAKVSASIGVAGFPEDASEAAQLLRAADDAMYLAKRSGKSRVRRAQDLAPGSSGRPRGSVRDF